MNQIKVQNVKKFYSNKEVVNIDSLNFDEVGIVALIGRNGAGKTTLLRLLSQRAILDSGSITWGQKSIVENNEYLGNIFCTSEVSIYGSKTLTEIFSFVQQIRPEFNLQRACELQKKFEIPNDTKYRDLSLGFKQIVQVVLSLSLPDAILYMDEPFNGLDAAHRELCYKLFLEDQDLNNRLVVISSHLVDELTSIASRILIMQDGRIILDQDCDELTTSYYSVVGSKEAIYRYTQDKEVIDIEDIGSLQMAYIHGQIPHMEIYPNLQFASVPIQKLFIKLTKGALHE